MGAANTAGLAQTIVPLLVVAIVMAIRIRGMRNARPLKLERLWIVPALYLALVGFIFAQSPPTRTGWLLALVGLVIGAAIGWQRGRMMSIHVDPETHALSQKSSPAAILLLLGLVVVRTAARSWFGDNPGAAHASAGTLLFTDALLGLALGLLSATRLEMALRARRLLAEARA